jgi:hopanoid C-3 methylase
MKILLVKPPINPNLLTLSIYEPLELEYLAASVKGPDVRILDMRIDRNLHKELLDFKPDLVGITAYTCDYYTVVKLLKEIREFDRSIKTAVGGHHATFMPEDFAIPCVDVIFLGYADTTFPRYVNALNEPEQLKNIPNLGLVDGDRLFFTQKDFSVPDLNSLPLPDRSLTLKYRKNYHDPIRNRLTLLMTSRGCQYRCNFCACWKLMDGKYCTRTPESIIEELKGLPEENEVIYFSDDNTFGDIYRMWKLCELIKKNNVKKKLQMYARADTVVRQQALFAELAGAGLQFLTVGFESFSDKDLDFYRKKTSVAVNNQAIQILKKLNIYIIAHFIIRPEYSEKDFSQLFRYVSDNNLFRPAYPVLTPLPGTRLYEETVRTFVITNFDFFDFTHSVLPTSLEPKEFYRQLTRIYIKSFSLIRYFRHRFKRLFSLDRERHFTDNTDGITAMRLLLITYHTIALYFKMRTSYLKGLRLPGKIVSLK